MCGIGKQLKDYFGWLVWEENIGLRPQIVDSIFMRMKIEKYIDDLMAENFHL